MRAYCPPDRLARHCRQLGLPFESLIGHRVAVGCPLCWPFNGAQWIILAPDEAGDWSGICNGCGLFAVQLLDLVRWELAADRIEAVAA